MNAIETIYQSITSGQRLSVADAVTLWRGGDFLQIARLANACRERLNGNKTYIVNNLHIDYSNICENRCSFCVFFRQAGQKGAFEFTIPQILQKIRSALPSGITAVHMVGGLHPTLPYEFYCDLLKSIKKEFPQILMRAFGAIEIQYFAKKFHKTIKQVLVDLMQCGLDSLPGGGAEIFAPSVRQKMCPAKGSAQDWLDVHEMAHSLGLKTNATMLYGHIESIEDRVQHMNFLRDLQDKTKGFSSFIPLAFHPKGTVYAGQGETFGCDDLKTIAMARLFLDNVPHIKAYWVSLGVAMAQIAQHFGADDLHGTVKEENIMHMAGSGAPQYLSFTQLSQLITVAGRIPVQEKI